ncbi:MAG TPA: hypothetical protein VF346_07135 [Bacteroidales bacterium]
MLKKLLSLFIYLLAISSCQYTQGQSIDSSSFKIYSRLSFYTFEKNSEFLLHIPPYLLNNQLTIDLKVNSEIVASFRKKPDMSLLRIPFVINLPPSAYKVEVTINVKSRPGVIYRAKTDLIILTYKSNEVKTDRFTGGLIVNNRQFFPFGFYCYSPVYPTLPEEEVVKGFNMISPYQKIMPETLNERKIYMDRCAELGMKVHYNLLSVSGGGGVGSKIDDLTKEEKRKRLITEIKTFRDHPALLGWYVSDEPNGNNVTPDELEEIYTTVRENDPWHPVSIVFMAPFLSSKKYADALDIVMADPYPIPNLPATIVGETTVQLKSEFKGKRPLWIVPQVFGGG